MKNTLTKKLVVILSALLLVVVLVFCVACDPYAGNYKEVSAEDREEFATNAIEKLDTIVEEGMNNFKMTYSITSSSERNGVKGTTKMEITLTVDGAKSLIEMKVDESDGEETVKFNSKTWIDRENEEIYYQITVDGKTEKGKFTQEDVEMTVELQIAIQYAQYAPTMATSLIEQIASSLTDEDVKLYADGDNFKIVEEDEEDKNECYFIFEKNGGFRCKFEMKNSYESDTLKSTSICFAEIVTSNDKVTMPNFD